MTYTDQQREFLENHRWAVLSTGRRDGSPQVSMVGYTVDGDDLIVSAKEYTAKWRNALRQPRVAVTVPDQRAHLVIYGTASGIDTDPERAELTARVFGALNDAEPPNPEDIAALLDEQQRTVLRIRPDKVLFHE